MNRWKAFLLHLLLSLAVVGAIATFALLAWYPHGLYRITGVHRLLLVILAFTVAAGPLLTLIVYKPGKRGLAFDLKVIAIVQVAFLGYGLHVLWSSRPVFLVGSDVRFTLVTAGEIDPEELAQASRPEWRKLPWHGPHLVGVLPPQDMNERTRLLKVYLETGRDLEQLPSQYLPFENVAEAVITHAVRLDGNGDTPNDPVGRSGLPVLAGNRHAWMTINLANGLPDTVVQQ